MVPGLSFTQSWATGYVNVIMNFDYEYAIMRLCKCEAKIHDLQGSATKSNSETTTLCLSIAAHVAGRQSKIQMQIPCHHGT